MSAKPNQPKSWFRSNTALKLFSLVIAFAFWVIVAMTNATDYRQQFSDVPVDTSSQADTMMALGLNIIEITPAAVNATVSGERLSVINLTPEDLAASLEIPANLTTSGVYELGLIPTGHFDENIKIEYSPSSVKVKIDRLVQKQFDVEAVISGLSVPQGYILEEKYTLTPAKVEVSGPLDEIDKITRCVIRADFTDPLEKTFADEFEVLLLDAQGNEMNPEEHHLTLSSDYAQLIVSVLKEKELPLIVEFTNIPRSFPLEDLTSSMTMSAYEIMTAGHPDVASRYSDLILGFIDIREIGLDNSTFIFDVELPTPQLQNLENVSVVILTFDTSNWDEAFFTVNVSDIILLNQPSYYDVEILSTSLNDVHITGDRDILEGLSADDIVVEVDFSQKELSEGQQRYPVKISVPGKGLVWATGEYSILLQVS